jgi:adenine-specific DNA-methyltransferase
MPSKLDDLKKKLRELFQLNRPDLDFGFYRIMHAKQDEIERFLDKDLLPQVKVGLSGLSVGGGSELEEAIKQAKALGVDPDTIPKVKELQAKYGTPVDLGKTEDAIYSHLLRFFSRYYDAGDFISMRRYKEGVYAIPYEGEEVVLHWANKDQYYVKSSENLRDYTVKLAEGDNAPRLHFKLIDADIEKDNRKAADDKKRVFIFNPEATEVLENEVVLGFEYRPDSSSRKQEALIEVCVDYVKEHIADFGDFASKLLSLKPTGKRKDRTLLEKHLSDYTSSNTMDYFIHKDLGGFLRRELDFYIKNEVMHLDDIEHESAARVEQYLIQIKVLRGIAHKLIDFLAQLEDFQKKLWLKKKFVVESNWCMTLDRVPEALYPEILGNEKQWEEWEKLGFVFKTKVEKSGELGLGDQDVPKVGTADYLKAFPYMVIDTVFFDDAFKQKLLASVENIDEQTNGILVHSENSQALDILHVRYHEQIKCIYIDPPYNTGEDGFIYKDGYSDSTWLACMESRLTCISPFFTKDWSSLWINIDDNEGHNLKVLCDSIFGRENFIATNIWQKRYSRENREAIGDVHDYIFTYSANPQSFKDSRHKVELTEKQAKVYTNPNNDRNGRWRTIPLTAQAGHATKDQFYEIKAPGGKIHTPPSGRCWGIAQATFKRYLDEGRIYFGKDNNSQPNLIRYLTEVDGITPWTWWPHEEVGHTDESKKELYSILEKETGFDTPKPSRLMGRIIRIATDVDSFVLDYFAGSGTTGHAVINYNREDGGDRKYILVEMGEYFDTVLKPRIQKVVFSKDWKDGKPISPESGISHCFKYLRLESYEDCLNNLELVRTSEQEDLLSKNGALKEDYTLRYMLDVESKGSLLNVQAFQDPFNYTLKVATGSVGETKPVNIDLIETFNYLIGLKVKTQDCIRGVTVLTGENLAGDKILVLWRKVAEVDSETLNTWFEKQDYSTQDMEFDLIYVNGDNHLENLRKNDEIWKVRLIEEEFQIRMFAGEGV